MWRFFTNHKSQVTAFMLIREYTPADLDALRRIHARQGFDYAFPNLDDPLFVSKLIVEDGEGRAVMASLARLTCEIYLLVDPGKGSRKGPGKESNNFRGEGNSRGQDSGALLVSGDSCAESEDARGAKATPWERYARLLALHRAAEQDLLARGLEDAHAWLPPPIAKRFGRRLESLGWVRDDAWTPYSRRLRP